MSEQRKDIINEVEELLERVILAEVNNAVWKKFGEVLSILDPQSLALFERHLEGIPTEVLASESNLSTEETRSLLKQIKKDLIQQLRKNCRVRQ